MFVLPRVLLRRLFSNELILCVAAPPQWLGLVLGDTIDEPNGNILVKDAAKLVHLNVALDVFALPGGDAVDEAPGVVRGLKMFDKNQVLLEQ